MQIEEIAVKKIIDQPIMTRQQSMLDDEYKKSVYELSKSIKTVGLLEPILVCKTGKTYTVIAGNRRLNAFRILKIETIPCIVKPGNVEENLISTAIENLQREDLNAIEKGEHINLLLSRLDTTKEKADLIKELAESIGKSPRLIHEWTRTAKEATPEDKADLKEGKTTATDLINKTKKKGSRVENQGSILRKAEKRFFSLSKDMVDRLKIIGSNGVEFKNNKNFKLEFKRLQAIMAVVDKAING